MERRRPERIGDSLLKDGKISQAQLKEAREIEKKEGRSLPQILVEKGYLSEEELASHSVGRYGYPYLPLSHYEMNPEAIKMIPEEIARKYLILPVDKVGNLLTIANATPLEAEAAEVIRKLTGCSLTYYISTISDIKNAIETYYGKHPQKETPFSS